ncbi:MAG: nucleotidyl transferase AbiEii/AbiGii toxin family protein [Desulfobacterales bacterium]|nr:MAG: nucleotidyl transferase AbiEii/AbiGii toxin family protein [Desulfobacterales bacterium]
MNTLNSHPFLKGKLALKGGSAINLFVFNIPRLSVDIDLNYIGAVEREKMLADRPKVEKAIEAVFAREGFTVRRKPVEHAGGKWRLSYQGFKGLSGNLEVDLNFMFRRPLWDVTSVNSQFLGDLQATNIPVLNIHELAAGKLCALISRQQGRDLFDSHQILSHKDLEQKRLRLAFVAYGGMNRKDWRTVSLQDADFAAGELSQQLLPLLRPRSAGGNESPVSYGKRLVKECRAKLSVVLPFTDSEMEFLNLLLDKGEIVPSLLTSDKDLQERISRHPLLEWKALNVREYKGR